MKLNTSDTGQFRMIHTLKRAFVPPVANFDGGRKNARFDIVESCRVERWGKSYPAMTRNISRGGIALDIIGMGSTTLDAELTIYLRDFEPVTAESRWSHKRTFGLKFISDLKNNADLHAFIEELEHTRKL